MLARGDERSGSTGHLEPVLVEPNREEGLPIDVDDVSRIDIASEGAALLDHVSLPRLQVDDFNYLLRVERMASLGRCEHHAAAVVLALGGVLGRPVERVARRPAEAGVVVVQAPLRDVLDRELDASNRELDKLRTLTLQD